jgi:hypothetical protein
MKKFIIILIVVIIVSAISYFIFIKNNSQISNTQVQNNLLPAVSTGTNNETTTNTVSSSENGMENLSNPTSSLNNSPRASDVFSNTPSGQTFQIQTPKGIVQVNNFYLSNPIVDEGGTLLIEQSENYTITYDPTTGAFWIIINGTPFDSFRNIAEQDFLKLLNISKGDACKLIVSISAPYDPYNPSSFKEFPLSFCPGSVQLK